MNDDPLQSPPPRAGRAVWLAAAVAGAGLLVVYFVFFYDKGGDGNAEAAVSQLTLADIPFDGTRAYDYLKKLCEIGPRPSGSPGMAAQQKLLEEHFRKQGAHVAYQRFRGRHPRDGSAVEMANMLIHWHPESKQRVLLAAHYDTLPFPLKDPHNPGGRFVGANDNASGVALLMELGSEIGKLKCAYGIDFLMIDAEEFIFTQRDEHFLGSQHFAREYVRNPPPYRYRWAVLLDMIGDRDLQIYHERNSAWWKDSQPLLHEIWGIAARLGVREFIPRRKYEILDDHIALHEIGKIPIIDIIDYDYAVWHTEDDTPEQCSALSLAKVGWVMKEWLQTVK